MVARGEGPITTMAELDTADRKPGEHEILLGVLDLVERDPSLTQRSVARGLGIALGLANAYLKRCIHKGLIKVSQVPPRRYAYYLTPQGFAEKSRLTASYLSYSFSFFRQARAQLDEIFATASKRGQSQIALVGEGDLAEIARLIASQHSLDVRGVVTSSHDPVQLAAAIKALGNVDAVVITAVTEPREAFDAATKILPPDRIHVPDLLRVRAAVQTREAES